MPCVAASGYVAAAARGMPLMPGLVAKHYPDRAGLDMGRLARDLPGGKE